MNRLQSVCFLCMLFILLVSQVLSAQAFKRVNIEIEKDSIAILEANPYSNDDVHGDFVVDGERIEDVEIHYRGAYYLFQLMRKGALRNWKIKTGKENRFDNRREWNFNYEDYIRQNLAYHLFRNAGVPCVSTENVILSVNGQKQGLYLKYEDPDNKKWLTEVFGDNDGDLYKAAYDMPKQTKYFGDLSYLGATDEDYFLHYRKQTNTKGEKEYDYSSIRNFTQFIDKTSDADFEKNIEHYFDVDEFIRYLIVANFSSNWDSYPFRPKNYFLYQNPKDGLWHFIPWDLDGTFQEVGGKNTIGLTGSVFHYFDGVEPYKYEANETLDRPLVWRLMKMEKVRNKYIWEYKKALESYLSKDSIFAISDSIHNSVKLNTSGAERNKFNQDVQATRSFVTKRTLNVQAELDKYDAKDPSLNLDKVEAFKSIIVYPNPSSGWVTIAFSNQAMVIKSVRVVNVLGQTVLFKALQKSDYTNGILPLNLDHLTVGQYVLQVKGDKYTRSTQISIQ